MKSNDPVDYQDTPRPTLGWRRSHLDPRTAGVWKQLQSRPDVPIAARTDIANPRSADRLRQDRAHRSHRGAHPQ